MVCEGTFDFTITGDIDSVDLGYNRWIFDNQGLFAHLNFFLQKRFNLKMWPVTSF